MIGIFTTNDNFSYQGSINRRERARSKLPISHTGEEVKRIGYDLIAVTTTPIIMYINKDPEFTILTCYLFRSLTEAGDDIVGSSVAN